MSNDFPGQQDPLAENAKDTPPRTPPNFTPPNFTPLSTPPPPSARTASRSGILTLVIILLAFAGGIGATIWGLPKIEHWWKDGAAPPSASDTDGQALLGGNNSAANVAAPRALMHDIDPLSIAALETRLAAASARMDIIADQANAAGGNAARAEGLLIAFATRRALDRGAPLGYLEGELRLRFGDSQPRAVATIINGAHASVTLAELQAQLEESAPALLGNAEGKSDWWEATRQDVSNLIIIRKADAPSPVPQRVIERAKLMISSARVTSALQEIEKLPNHEKADEWIQMARKYNEIRRALDVIEAAAILEPRSIPSSPRIPGVEAMQVAPPPPMAPHSPADGGIAGNMMGGSQ